MTSKLSYQRLRHEDEEEEGRGRGRGRGWVGFNEGDYQEAIEKAIQHVRARTIWPSSSSSSRRLIKRVHIKKRLKVKIPSLKKFLRRKARLVVVSLAKVVKRLKESQAHFGDLFAGNYLFMQVTPTSTSTTPNFKFPADHKSIHGFSSRYSISA